MPSGRVVTKDEIYLNGYFYPLKRAVQSQLASVYPGKVVTGDTNKDSDPNRSAVIWSDMRGGLGMEIMEGAADVDRVWWSTMQLRYKGHTVLPALATETAAYTSADATPECQVLIEYANEAWACIETEVFKYDNVADSWGSNQHTLPAAATDAIVAKVGGTDYLIIACGTDVVTYDGNSWTDLTDDVKYLTWWDDKIWGIDSTGQLKVSATLSGFDNDAQLPTEDGMVTDLFTGRDALGNEIIYANTKLGLYAHDIDNLRFHRTELELPIHPDAGLGSAKWRDAIYMPAGLSVYKYVNGANATITVMGPDRDHGLPADKRGTIKQLIPTHNELLAVLDATVNPTTYDLYEQSQEPVIGPSVGFSMILGWNGVSWEVKWVGGSSTKAITTAAVMNAYSTYRLWWAHNEKVMYMSLPRDIINPQHVTTFEYGASGTLETPWFTGGQQNVDKLALAVDVDCNDMSSDETFEIQYATDFSDSYTSLGTITASGTTRYELPDSTDPTGIEFRSIRFKVIAARGATTTNSPDLDSLSLEYVKKLKPKWGHSVVIELTSNYKGQTVAQMRANLLTMTEQNLLGEFTFRNDDGNDRNFYVRVQSATNLEATGEDERGESMLYLAEV